MQKIGVTAFILDSDKVLIVRRSQEETFLPGYYELPGGKVEFGESPEQALKREIKEETNLEIEVIKPYDCFSYLSSDNERHTIDIQFITKLTDNPENIKLSKEHDAFEWISKDDISKYQFSDEMKKVIEKGFNNIN